MRTDSRRGEVRRLGEGTVDLLQEKAEQRRVAGALLARRPAPDSSDDAKIAWQAEVLRVLGHRALIEDQAQNPIWDQPGYLWFVKEEVRRLSVAQPPSPVLVPPAASEGVDDEDLPF